MATMAATMATASGNQLDQIQSEREMVLVVRVFIRSTFAPVGSRFADSYWLLIK
jgi:hypothetical protein